MKIKKFLSALLIGILIISMSCSEVLSLSWDGASSGGGGNSSAASGGYRIAFDNNTAVGYRFTLVNADGKSITKCVDVFKNSLGTSYISMSKFTKKFNKKELASIYTATFNTSSGRQTDDYFDTDLGVVLPSTTDGMADWQEWRSNLDAVLEAINGSTTTTLIYGDKVIIEPIWQVTLEGVKHVLTVSEIGVYGGAMFGFDTIPSSGNNEDSWDYISNCTNKHYPNALYTPNGQGLWSGVSAASSRLSFKDMITKGYGVAIAYTADTDCKVQITFVPNGGTAFGTTAATTKTYDINTAISLPTATRSGYALTGWYSSASGGSKYGDGGSSYVVTKNITMYAQWKKQTKYVYYNANADGDLIVDNEDTTGVTGTMAKSSGNYGSEVSLRANAFSRSGYNFGGWVVGKLDNGTMLYRGKNSAGTLGWYKKSEIKTYSIYADTSSVWVYTDLYAFAQWKIQTRYVYYNANADGDLIVDNEDTTGVTGTMAKSSGNYGSEVSLRANAFSRSGYNFGGWVVGKLDNGTMLYRGTNSAGTLGWYKKSEIKTYSIYADTSSVWVYTDLYAFAQWSYNSATIIYNANADGDLKISGGDKTNVTGSMEKTDIDSSWITTLRINDFARVEYTFDSWIAARKVNGEYLYYGYNTADDYSDRADAIRFALAKWYSADEIVRYYEFSDMHEFDTRRLLQDETGFTIIMFAQWKENSVAASTYTIKYYPNSTAAIGSMSDQTVGVNDTVNLYRNQYKRTGYKFIEWTDVRNGRTYTDMEQITALADAGATVPLYASWEPIQYNVKFDANGGSGTMKNMLCTYDATYNLTKNAFVKTGYKFVEWIDINGNKYSDEQQIKNLLSINGGTVTLYAIWTPITYTVKFNPDDSDGEMDDLPCVYDISQKLPGCIFNKVGYEFVEWIDDDGVKYPDKDEILNITDEDDDVINLYPLWTPITYTIRFDPNGGSGTMDDMLCVYDITHTLTENSFTRSGYIFKGWISDRGISYTDKEKVRNLTNKKGDVITLYAVWEANFDCDLGIYANSIYGNIMQGYDMAVSAVVENYSDINITPDNAATVTLTCSNADGTFDVQTQSVIVPANNVQLVWFTVSVPYSDEEYIKFAFDVVPYEVGTDNDTSNNSSIREAETDVYVITNTDIPEYELEATVGFDKYLSPEERTKDTFSYQYWVWNESNARFDCVTSLVEPNEDYTVNIKPDISAGWQEQDGEDFKTRSGYGVNVTSEFTITGDIRIGTLRVDILYPEFNYSNSIEKYTSMTTRYDEGVYYAELPEYTGELEEYGAAHYTPMWYPDKEYNVELHAGGIWCPLGEIRFTAANTNTLTIDGSLWDDYYSTYYGNKN